MKQTVQKILLSLIFLFLPLIASGQELVVNKHKLNTFTTAIAHAEGFGVRRAIPTRYHNPGDLKCTCRKGKFRFDGMRGVGKGGHVIFKDDAAGWAALKTQVTMILDGRSRNFHADMTINQVAKVYAGQWRRWSTNVSNELGVPPTTTLAEYFDLPVEPPTITSLGTQGDTLAELLKSSNSVPPILAQD